MDLISSKIKIQAIIFDLVGVLLFKKKNHHADAIENKIDQMIGTVTDDKKFTQETRARFNLTEREFASRLKKIAEKYEKFDPLWSRLPQLRSSCRLGIINNGTALTWPYFEKFFRISEVFDWWICSALEGLAKPDPRIYRLAIDKFKIKPDKILFMDDNQRNVEVAAQLGMLTIWWPDREEGFRRFKQMLT